MHLNILEKIQHLQPAFRQTPGDRRLTHARVCCAQGMISALSPRDDGIGVLRQTQKVGQKRRRDKRHVAGQQDQTVVAGRGQGGIKASKRSAVGRPIGHNADVLHPATGTSADQQDVIGNLAELVKLTIQNRAAADDQGAFVASVKPAGSAAHENRRARHNSSILPPP
jgi:hypothetical protein